MAAPTPVDVDAATKYGLLLAFKLRRVVDTLSVLLDLDEMVLRVAKSLKKHSKDSRLLLEGVAGYAELDRGMRELEVMTGAVRRQQAFAMLQKIEKLCRFRQLCSSTQQFEGAFSPQSLAVWLSFLANAYRYLNAIFLSIRLHLRGPQWSVVPFTTLSDFVKRRPILTAEEKSLKNARKNKAKKARNREERILSDFMSHLRAAALKAVANPDAFAETLAQLGKGTQELEYDPEKAGQFPLGWKDVDPHSAPPPHAALTNRLALLSWGCASSEQMKDRLPHLERLLEDAESLNRHLGGRSISVLEILINITVAVAKIHQTSGRIEDASRMASKLEAQCRSSLRIGPTQYDVYNLALALSGYFDPRDQSAMGTLHRRSEAFTIFCHLPFNPKIKMSSHVYRRALSCIARDFSVRGDVEWAVPACIAYRNFAAKDLEQMGLAMKKELQTWFSEERAASLIRDVEAFREVAINLYMLDHQSEAERAAAEYFEFSDAVGMQSTKTPLETVKELTQDGKVPLWSQTPMIDEWM